MPMLLRGALRGLRAGAGGRRRRGARRDAWDAAPPFWAAGGGDQRDASIAPLAAPCIPEPHSIRRAGLFGPLAHAPRRHHA